MESKFKNLKIAITDNDHLKVVCDVLDSVGFVNDYGEHIVNWVNVYGGKHEGNIYDLLEKEPMYSELVTLSDLLKMRDEMVKHNAKSSQE